MLTFGGDNNREASFINVGYAEQAQIGSPILCMWPKPQLVCLEKREDLLADLAAIIIHQDKPGHRAARLAMEETIIYERRTEISAKDGPRAWIPKDVTDDACCLDTTAGTTN